MQHSKKNLLVAVALIAIGLFFTIEAQAQCVGCVPAPPGWICMAAGQGGEACAMDGVNCTLINPCTCRDRDCPQGLMRLASNEKVKLNISDEVIRAIGKTHPRAALALVSLRKLPPLGFSEGRINSAPVELTQADVEGHLESSRKSTKYFAQLKQRVQESFSQDVTPAVFKFWVEQSLTGNGFVLKLQPEETLANDLSFSLLEVNLTSGKESESRAKEKVTRLEATTWQIN